MTTYGADATGSYEIPNYITQKEGVKDSSAAIFLGAAGKAAEKGLAIDEAYQSRDIRTEISNLVDYELGRSNKAIQSLTADGQGASEGSATAVLLSGKEDVFNFKQEVDRASQIKKLGGKTAATRIEFEMQNRVREKITERPWLADTYRKVSSEVLGDYDSAIKLISAQEEKIMEAMSEDKMRENLIKHAYTISAEVNLAFPVPPELMTTPQLMGYIQEVSRVRQADRQADIAMENAKMDMLIAQTNASLEASRASITAFRVQTEALLAKENDKEFVNGTVTALGQRVNNKIAEITNLLKNGGFVVDETALERDAATFIANTRAEFSKRVGEYQWADPALKRQEIEEFDRKLKGLSDLFTGDMSNTKERMRTLDKLNTDPRIDLFKYAPETARAFALGGTVAAGNIVSGWFNQENGQFNREILSRGLDGTVMRSSDAQGIQTRAWVEIQETGTPTSIPQANWNVIRSETLNTVMRGAITDPAIKEYLDAKPNEWGNTMQFILSGRESYGIEDRAAVVDYGFDNFKPRFEKLKTTDPTKAEDLADTARIVAQETLPYVLREAEQLRVKPALTPENRFRAPSGSTPETRRAVGRMNKVLDVLVATQGGKGDPTIEVLNTYFNAGIQQEQPK